MTPEQILATHPAPWRHIAGPGNIIRMIDANNQVVELFTMIEFCQQVTARMAQPAPAPSPSPAP